MNPYLGIFQVVMAIYTVMGLGVVSGYLKMFGLDDASIIRKIDYLICVPGMFFRRIGLKKLNYHDWKPFIIEVLVQATIHILFLLVLAFYPSGSRIKKYLESLFSNCYVNLVITGYPFVRAMYGDEYLYVPVFANIVTMFIIVPLHTLLVYPIPKDVHETEEKYYEEEEDELEDGIEVGTGSVYNVTEAEKNSVQVDEHGNPSLSSSDSRSILNEASQNKNEHSENESSIQLDQKKEEERKKSKKGHHKKNHGKKAEEEKKEKEAKSDEAKKSDGKDSKNDKNNKDEDKKPFKPPDMWWKAFLWALITPSTVFIILGIVWSAIGVKMPIFLDSTSGYLEKAVMGAGLFAIGTFMWEHPFKDCPWKFVTVNILFHFVCIPLIAALWSWVLKADKVVSQIMVFIHSMPSALVGYAMTLSAGFGMKVASFTFYWSNLVFLPALFLWCVVIREAGLFKDPNNPASL